jgi:death-on-curing protein
LASWSQPSFRPQTTIGGHDACPDIHTKAGALLHSLAHNHAFVDGNKRTALIATYVFYRLNGYMLVAKTNDIIGLMLDAAQSQLTVEAIAGSLKNWVTEVGAP